MTAKKQRKNARRAVILRDGFECWLCEEACTGHDKTLDHIVPRSCGGLRTQDNLLLAHRKCNEERGNDITPLIPAIIMSYFLEAEL